MSMNIFLVGLRRSGTTAFWRIFRQDERFISYKEPFNPLLKYLPVEDKKNTHGEFINLFNKNPSDFRKIFSSISFEHELTSEISSNQKKYLHWLCQTNENNVFSFTRCNFKLSALHAIDSRAILLHLYRSPSAMVSSHLLPSGDKLCWRSRVGDKLRKLSFWQRKSWYNNWNFEDIIDGASKIQFKKRLLETGLDADSIINLPAVVKLLAYWKINFEYVENTGKQLFDNRFISVSFEEFCKNPKITMECIYKLIPFSMPLFDYSSIHTARPGFCTNDSRWKQYYKLIGLSENFFNDSK